MKLCRNYTKYAREKNLLALLLSVFIYIKHPHNMAINLSKCYHKAHNKSDNAKMIYFHSAMTSITTNKITNKTKITPGITPI